ALPMTDQLGLTQKGRWERSTLPPEKITPSLGFPPSGRAGRFRAATAPGLRSGAIATAEDGSMTILRRSQMKRIAEMISASLTRRTPARFSRRIANVRGESDAR